MRLSILILSFLLLLALTNNPALSTVAPDADAVVPVVRDQERHRQQAREQDLLERRQHLPAITTAFARRTGFARACRLTWLCYETTLGTPFKPIDLAEIALAETGGHRLSPRAVSHRGALGVWQLMPQRARSHGFTPEEMSRDDRCAEAAVRELAVKLSMADGDLEGAKRLYCGAGPQARAYQAKLQRYRREILSLARGVPSGEPRQVSSL